MEPETLELPDGHTVTVCGTLKMGEFRAWVQAEEDGDLLRIYGYLARLITAWDYPAGDPTKIASYDELDMAQYRMVVMGVTGYLRQDKAKKA